MKSNPTKQTSKLHRELTRKTVAGKTLTDSQLLEIIKNGKSSLIKGFLSKAGKKFDAYLVLDETEWKAKFEFPEKK